MRKEYFEVNIEIFEEGGGSFVEKIRVYLSNLDLPNMRLIILREINFPFNQTANEISVGRKGRELSDARVQSFRKFSSVCRPSAINDISSNKTVQIFSPYLARTK